MTYFDYINLNIDRIKQEIKMGITYSSVINHYAIYSRYDYYRKLGNPVSKASFFASEDLKISERSILKIKKQMETVYENK